MIRVQLIVEYTPEGANAIQMADEYDLPDTPHIGDEYWITEIGLFFLVVRIVRNLDPYIVDVYLEQRGNYTDESRDGNSQAIVDELRLNYGWVDINS